jgi:hypothetical protein
MIESREISLLTELSTKTSVVPLPLLHLVLGLNHACRKIEEAQIRVTQTCEGLTSDFGRHICDKRCNTKGRAYDHGVWTPKVPTFFPNPRPGVVSLDAASNNTQPVSPPRCWVGFRHPQNKHAAALSSPRVSEVRLARARTGLSFPSTDCSGDEPEAVLKETHSRFLGPSRSDFLP